MASGAICHSSLPCSCSFAMHAAVRNRASFVPVLQQWLRVHKDHKGLRPVASIWHHRNPYDFDELKRKGLAEQSPLQSIDEVEHQRRRDEQGHAEAKEAAIKILSRRPHSQKELRTKLMEKGFSTELIKGALERLKEVNLQSDEHFAEVFARSKWRTSKWGPAKLEAELARRGVAREHVSSALSSVFGDEGLQLDTHIEDLDWKQGGGGERSRGGAASTAAGSMEGSALEFEADANPAEDLLVAARRQYEQSRGLKPESRRRRLVGWLQRRGHRWEDISRLVKQLEKEAAAQALDAPGE